MILAHLDLDRRCLLAGAASLALTGAAAAQEAWPKGRQIRFVLPFAPAGATDGAGALPSQGLSCITLPQR